MIAVIAALANSPLVWFAVLVLSLTSAGVLYRLAGRPEPAQIATPTPQPMSAREARYHSSNQIGR